ncbi:MAG: hypothetical protein QG622_1102 [Actinomycetota bacterium]|nr:hypothetical protein [Actinomycetota bacterium]
MATHPPDPAPGTRSDPHPGAPPRRPGGPIRSAARAARSAGAVSRRAGTATWRGIRHLTHSKGAGESGLGRVIELHLVASFADTLIVTALASTIFFAVPTEAARGRVATSLLVTMVPFTLLAPVIGPLLDRVLHGRRYAIATTLVVRAFLSWVMADSVRGASGTDAAFGLYPAAFGFLVCQKVYIVTRAAALPRVLPHGTGLVAANSRISLAGVAAMGLGGALGTGLTTWAGPSWTLRLAFAVFAAGTALALALPGRIDSGEGEVDARMSSDAERDGPERPLRAGSVAGDPVIARLARGTSPASGTGPERPAPARRPRWSIGPLVVLGLRSNATVRAFTGFLTLFLAFRLRTEPLDGFSESSSVVLVVVLAGVGGGAGNALGALLRRIRPERVVVLVLAMISAASVWAALGYGPAAVATVAVVAGTAQSLGKLCLDALVQREIPEQVRTSAFARSETVLQLAWVLGGGIGLVLPLSGAWGLGLAALATASMTGLGVATLARLRR